MYHGPIVAAPPPPLVRPRFERRSLAPSPAWLSALVLLAVAVLLRRGQFGNPIAGLDEQLYLLAGDRMWHGELPFVDIWDRKPFGLFLLFAGIRTIPGEPFLVAQLVATGFAAATAWGVALFVRSRVGWVAATLAGMFYLAEMVELWGDTTQSPVFYNLFVIAAALIVRDAAQRPLAGGATARMAAAMLLAGLAVQVKTNAVFEGGFFAAWYLGCRWRAGGGVGATLGRGALLALAGAVPTLAAVGFYGATGHFGAWWQANVLSILAKGRPDDAAVAATLAETVILVMPMVLAILFGLWARTRRFVEWDRGTAFMLGWIVVAAVDLVAIGGYFPHYALPLMLAGSTMAANGFARGRAGRLFWAAAMVWPAIHTQYLMPISGAADRAIAKRVRAAIPADVATRCLFVFEGPVAYYQLTDACRVTRYAFSAHISSRREAAALGQDPSVALAEAMAHRPGTVITLSTPPRQDANPVTARQLAAILHRDYRVVALLPHRSFTVDQTVVLWRRRDLPYRKL